VSGLGAYDADAAAAIGAQGETMAIKQTKIVTKSDD
jgi:hypothetical protein